MGPSIPDDVEARDLDRTARGRLRTLSRENADRVARHLVMAGRLLDNDPELAYQHAQAAVRAAGRVDVVREAAGIAAYHTGRYAEALRELRTVRRLNGSSEHLPVMADCERGLGRPERAIALSREPEAAGLDKAGQVELAMVVAGARLDMNDPEGALVALDVPPARAALGELGDRVALVRADALEAAGRRAEAAIMRSGLVPDEDVVVVDLEDDDDLDDDDLDDDDLDDDDLEVADLEVADLEDAWSDEGSGGAEDAAEPDSDAAEPRAEAERTEDDPEGRS